MTQIQRIKGAILDKPGKSDNSPKVERKTSPPESKKQLQRLKERFLKDNTLGSDTGFYQEALTTMRVIEGFEMFGSQYELNKRKRFVEAQREATGGKRFAVAKRKLSPIETHHKPAQTKRVDLLAGKLD